jgi:hypothetical protein
LAPSNANPAIVGSQKLVFTPANYNIVQQIKLIGLPVSAAPESFHVRFNMVSSDEACNQLNGSRAYTINHTHGATLMATT